MCGIAKPRLPVVAYFLFVDVWPGKAQDAHMQIMQYMCPGASRCSAYMPQQSIQPIQPIRDYLFQITRYIVLGFSFLE